MEQRKVYGHIGKNSGQSDKDRLFLGGKDDPEDLGGFSLTAIIEAGNFENGELSCSYVYERLNELSENIAQKSASADFEDLKRELYDFLVSIDRELSYVSGVKKRPFSAYAGLCLVISNSAVSVIQGPLQFCVRSGGILRFLTPADQDGQALGSGGCNPSVFDAVLSGPSCALLCDSGSAQIPAASISDALSDPSDKALSRIALEASRSGASGRRLLVCTSLSYGDRR